jgi:CMP-N,N'-diacetyllegionaminic acid synthase
MNILAVIPARGGSKGIPRKNLQPLAGKPLMGHMISSALSSKHINRVVVSTEDEEIASVARSLGAEVPFLRPKSLAEDLTPMIAVSKATMEALAEADWQADIVVQLAIPCPFIPVEKIDKAISYIIEGADCAVTLKRIEHEHPYRAKQLNADGSFESFIKHIPVESFISRQELPTLYCTSGAVYTWKASHLAKWTGKDFGFGPKPMGVVVTDAESVNIDRPIDLEFARFMASKREEALSR